MAFLGLGAAGAGAAGATGASALGAGMAAKLAASLPEIAGATAPTAATSLAPLSTALSGAGGLTTSMLSPSAGAGGAGFLSNALAKMNAIEQNPGLQMAQKLRPFLTSSPAPPLSGGGGQGAQVIPRRKVTMF